MEMLKIVKNVKKNRPYLSPLKTKKKVKLSPIPYYHRRYYQAYYYPNDTYK